MLLALTVLWGSAFALTKVAVAGLPPELVVSGRLLVACLVLLPLALLAARRPPADARLWLFFVLIAIFGNALPFSLIAWGQRYIDSGLAGILMAIMPLMTLALSHYFVEGERLTPLRLAGFVSGFAGVIVLMGPDAVVALADGAGNLLPMIAVLAGAVSYAVAAVLARLRPPSGALTTAAATTTVAAAMMVPLLVPSVAGAAPVSASPEAWVATGVLGVFSTALATVVYFRLIRSAGPTFVSQINYLIPLWAVVVGILFLDEAPEPSHLYALALILGGILASRRTPARATAWARRSCRVSP
jgi:drug/metabolite transporter (DMT)-like permease